MWTAFPSSNYYGHADSLQTHRRFSERVSTPLLPLSLTLSARSPQFSTMDSTRPFRWRLPINLYLLPQAPEWVQGTSGSSAPSFSRLKDDKPIRSVNPIRHRVFTTRWPIRQSLEPGVQFPVGRNPLRLDSPCDLLAKPGLLTVCLVGRDRARCFAARFSIPPVVTVRATFTAHGDRLLDLRPLSRSANIGRHSPPSHSAGLLLGCQ